MHPKDQNALKLTDSNLEFQIFFGGEDPGTPPLQGGKGRGREKRGGKGREREALVISGRRGPQP